MLAMIIRCFHYKLILRCRTIKYRFLEPSGPNQLLGREPTGPMFHMQHHVSALRSSENQVAHSLASSLATYIKAFAIKVQFSNPQSINSVVDSADTVFVFVIRLFLRLTIDLVACIPCLQASSAVELLDVSAIILSVASVIMAVITRWKQV